MTKYLDYINKPILGSSTALPYEVYELDNHPDATRLWATIEAIRDEHEELLEMKTSNFQEEEILERIEERKKELKKTHRPNETLEILKSRLEELIMELELAENESLLVLAQDIKDEAEDLGDFLVDWD